jgi:hypothetical protein
MCASDGVLMVLVSSTTSTNDRSDYMWWGIGIGGAILYLVLLFVLGLTTLRKGHWVMFILGIFLPLFWLIGAVIPPRAAATS